MYLSIDIFRDFPERGYVWSKFWEDNSVPPIVYHGTNSYSVEKITTEGLVPGRNMGLDPNGDISDLINLVDESTLPETVKQSLKFDCRNTLVWRDASQLSFALAPFLAVKYSLSSPECLDRLLMHYRNVMKAFSDNGVMNTHPSFERVRQKIYQYHNLAEDLEKYGPILVGISINPSIFCSLPAILSSREDFERVRRLVGRSELRLRSYARGYPLDKSIEDAFNPMDNELITLQKIPAENIVSITHIKTPAP